MFEPAILPPGDGRCARQRGLDTGYQFGHGRAEPDDDHPDHQRADACLLGQRHSTADEYVAANDQRDEARRDKRQRNRHAATCVGLRGLAKRSTTIPVIAETSDPPSTPELDRGDLLRIDKREVADKQAHGEADPGEAGQAVYMAETDAFGQPRPAGFHGEPAGAENTQLLADDEARRNSQRQRREQRVQPRTGKGHAGIREGEDRQDEEGYPWVQGMLEPFERPLFARRDRYEQRGHHARQRRMDTGF